MVGRDAEWSGIIRAGAQMVSAVANPRAQDHGYSGRLLWCGPLCHVRQGLRPAFSLPWPTARFAVMSGASAASTLVEIKIRRLERGGKQLSEEEKSQVFASIKASYDEQTDGRYAVPACGWTPSSIRQKRGKYYSPLFRQ